MSTFVNSSYLTPPRLLLSGKMAFFNDWTVGEKSGKRRVPSSFVNSTYFTFMPVTIGNVAKSSCRSTLRVLFVCRCSLKVRVSPYRCTNNAITTMFGGDWLTNLSFHSHICFRCFIWLNWSHGSTMMDHTTYGSYQFNGGSLTRLAMIKVHQLRGYAIDPISRSMHHSSRERRTLEIVLAWSVGYVRWFVK